VASLLKCSYVCFLGVLYIHLDCVNNLNHIIYYRYSFSVPIPVSHALLVIAPPIPVSHALLVIAPFALLR
jgi:hypothetical protein